MDGSQLVAMLEAQRDVLKHASKKKGQEATSKPDRKQLLRGLATFNSKQGYSASMRTCLISFAYPPSTTPLSELESMLISDLRLETHHTGRVLLLRTLCKPIGMTGVHTAVEDAAGNVDRLAIYNTNPLLMPQDLVPEQRVFAVKEPYYKFTADGGYAIRVDHPCDMICLEPSDPYVPLPFKVAASQMGGSPQSYKDQGNACYRKKNYFGAVKQYSYGIGACTEEDNLLLADLYRNRSIANTLLGRYESALADATAAILTPSDTIDVQQVDALNLKTFHRAGRANYELGQFQEASRNFINALRIDPGNADALKEQARVMSRLKEMTGIYDFDNMSKVVSSTSPRLDHASFLKKVEVRSAGDRGQGLFATTSIVAGDLVLCEKAIVSCFDKDPGNDFYILLNVNTNKAKAGSQASLLFRTIDKLQHNPSLAREFLDLYAGGYQPKCAAQQVDGITAIDTFHTQAVIEYNNFGHASLRSSDVISYPEADGKAPTSFAVCLMASRINHACNGNVSRCHFGDMLVIRAARDIAQGEEITMHYRRCTPDHAQDTKLLDESWGFKCTCSLCQAEASIDAVSLRKRAALLRRMESVLSDHKFSARYQPSQAAIKQVKELYQKLEATYSQELFAGIPRKALLGPSQWLCQAYATATNIQECKHWATMILRNLGYVLTIRNSAISMARDHATIDIAAVDASLHLSNCSLGSGDFSLAQAFRTMGKDLYLVLFGELRGFEERYGKGM